MSKARSTIESNESSAFSNAFKWLNINTKIAAEFGWNSWLWIYANGRMVGWFIVTTGMITAVPLLFEVKRESILEDLEQIQIGKQLAEGRTPQELAFEGLTAAVEPKVLN
uniref:Mitochondrial import receptor subunit TOM22 homolog n=1 Tax=Spumella elongata TaxID=89044 RepID=A0A7S3HMU8_9STRA|mmetsp:Transcript_59926/g.105358  ORF Transcript_59926/g.105358 Transcript_59926/m.105358 type:complete len:110 (+) Transcript_59926:89-418(+)|eukprot:CAMPEP_0184986266 /NCGR_PEP_ID=MMETSP1098-20130426/15905_1 /TAXON_ID=89044 /ORGANISM="Spumella elongata, Strain CCAP 955/1" /LENGTH=109 /DNA_ID=CAMNT_0027510465 /DNA_START=69 /DNA_END=398 /DNA_ORIENTATION=-